jgi:hypothetical protein
MLDLIEFKNSALGDSEKKVSSAATTPRLSTASSEKGSDKGDIKPFKSTHNWL